MPRAVTVLARGAIPRNPPVTPGYELCGLRRPAVAQPSARAASAAASLAQPQDKVIPAPPWP